MRALLHTQSTNTLSLSTSHPSPTPSKSNEYLLRIHACALTPGELSWPRPPHLNTSIPGVEAAGTIVSTPHNPKFAVGDEVFWRTTYPRSGNACEFAVALEEEMALKSKGLSWEEAASIPVAALTAWQGIFHHAVLPSQADTKLNVLVNGASGATGIWLVQLLHATGHAVTGVCSGRNVEFVKRFGAEEVIDYTTNPILTHTYDVVFDCVGNLEFLWPALAPNGRLWTIVMPGDLDVEPRAKMDWSFKLRTPEGAAEGVEGRFFIMESSGSQLAKIGELVDEGKCRAVVDSMWELEEFEKAFERVGSSRAKGKVVLKV